MINEKSWNFIEEYKQLDSKDKRYIFFKNEPEFNEFTFWLKEQSLRKESLYDKVVLQVNWIAYLSEEPSIVGILPNGKLIELLSDGTFINTVLDFYMIPIKEGIDSVIRDCSEPENAFYKLYKKYNYRYDYEYENNFDIDEYLIKEYDK